jgi:hypothetical protein
MPRPGWFCEVVISLSAADLLGSIVHHVRGVCSRRVSGTPYSSLVVGSTPTVGPVPICAEYQGDDNGEEGSSGDCEDQCDHTWPATVEQQTQRKNRCPCGETRERTNGRRTHNKRPRPHRLPRTEIRTEPRLQAHLAQPNTIEATNREWASAVLVENPSAQMPRS